MNRIDFGLEFLSPDAPDSRIMSLNIRQMFLLGDGRIGRSQLLLGDGHSDSSVYAFVSTTIWPQQLSVASYQDMLDTIAGQLEKVAANTANAVSEALNNKELIDRYCGWVEVRLSDFSIAGSIDLDDGKGLTVDPKSLCLMMKAPRDQETSELPLNDPQSLPKKLIEWLGEISGVRLKPRV